MTIHVLKAAHEGAGLAVTHAAPAWLDRSGVVTVGTRPDDPPEPHFATEMLAAAAASLHAVLPLVEAVLREVDDAGFTHTLAISDPMYIGHRLWLVRLADPLPADDASAEAQGFEHVEAEMTVLPDDHGLAN